jgi:hypothetical protein
MARADMTLLKQHAYISKMNSLSYYKKSTLTTTETLIHSSLSDRNNITTPLFSNPAPVFNHKGYWGFNYMGSTRVAGRIRTRDYPLTLRLSIGNSKISLK